MLGKDEKIATKADILRLLKDYRWFVTPHGGAGALEESYLSGAAYGPAGMVLSGSGYSQADRRGLKESYRVLTVALQRLRAEHFQEWGSLIEPYLSDTADPSVVDDWRRKVAGLQEENKKRRERNRKREERAAQGKKHSPFETERVAFVFASLQLTRHDRAVARLAGWLKDKDLHVVNPCLMSASEEAAGERANAQMMAYYHACKAAGRSHAGAISAVAWKFGISEHRVETIVQFRSENMLASCAEPGCGRAVYSQNLCSKHYQRQRKARKNRKAS